MEVKLFYKIISLFLLAFIILFPARTSAKPEYAEQTSQNCETCHIEEGGPLTQTGLDFAASGYRWPPPINLKAILPLPKFAKILVGFLHILTAFAWFGTIIYVHIILKPAYASRGLPKSEVGLGIWSMAIMVVTGILLTLSKISSLEILYHTPWGKLLLVKTSLFMIMVGSAMIVVYLIGPKLMAGPIKASVPPNGVFDTATLAAFDGKEGKPAFIVYQDKVYELSQSKLWPEGLHVKRHLAGADLTEELSKAPHGEEKLNKFKVLGTYDPSLPPPKTMVQRLFYFMAYLNLVLVFIILLVISFWKWGI